MNYNSIVKDLFPCMCVIVVSYACTVCMSLASGAEGSKVSEIRDQRAQTPTKTKAARKDVGQTTLSP